MHQIQGKEVAKENLEQQWEDQGNPFRGPFGDCPHSWRKTILYFSLEVVVRPWMAFVSPGRQKAGQKERQSDEKTNRIVARTRCVATTPCPPYGGAATAAWRCVCVCGGIMTTPFAKTGSGPVVISAQASGMAASLVHLLELGSNISTVSMATLTVADLLKHARRAHRQRHPQTVSS